MSFNFTCPFCHQAMQCEDAWVGMQAKCPTCGQTVTLSLAVPNVPVPPPPVSSMVLPPPQTMPMPGGQLAQGSVPDAQPKSGSSVVAFMVVLMIIAVLAVSGFFVFRSWNKKRIQEYEQFLVKTAEQLVEEIIEEKVSGVDVTEVSVYGLTKVSSKHYEARAEVIVHEKNKWRNREKGSCKIKIEDHGEQIRVEIDRNSWINLK